MDMRRLEMAEALANWCHGDTMLSGDGWDAEILCVFDHDYEQHLLVLEWFDMTNIDRNCLLDYASSSFRFSLWFIGQGDSSCVSSWSADNCHHSPPFVAAATIVEDWKNLQGEFGHLGLGTAAIGCEIDRLLDDDRQ